MTTTHFPQLPPAWANVIECALLRGLEHHADRGRYWREQETVTRLLGMPESARLCEEAAAAQP